MPNNIHQTTTTPDAALLHIIAAHRIRTLHRQSKTLRALGLTDVAATFEQWADGLRRDLAPAPAPARVQRTRTVGIWHGGAQ